MKKIITNSLVAITALSSLSVTGISSADTVSKTDNISTIRQKPSINLNTTLDSKRSIAPLIIDGTSGFLGVISPNSPYIGTFDSDTNTIVYEDSIIRPTDSPILKEFTNIHFRAWDSAINGWVETTGKCDINYLDVGSDMTYVRLRYTWTMTPSQAATYNNFEVSADWVADFVTPPQSIHSYTRFRIF